jgi:hypothetical protein
MILFSNVKESAFDTNNVNAKFERWHAVWFHLCNSVKWWNYKNVKQISDCQQWKHGKSARMWTVGGWH